MGGCLEPTVDLCLIANSHYWVFVAHGILKRDFYRHVRARPEACMPMCARPIVHHQASHRRHSSFEISVRIAHLVDYMINSSARTATCCSLAHLICIRCRTGVPDTEHTSKFNVYCE